VPAKISWCDAARLIAWRCNLDKLGDKYCDQQGKTVCFRHAVDSAAVDANQVLKRLVGIEVVFVLINA